MYLITHQTHGPASHHIPHYCPRVYQHIRHKISSGTTVVANIDEFTEKVRGGVISDPIKKKDQLKRIQKFWS